MFKLFLNSFVKVAFLDWKGTVSCSQNTIDQASSATDDSDATDIGDEVCFDSYFD